MIWRERVREEVEAVLETWKHDLQGLTPDGIKAVAADIADSIPSPDERNGYLIVPMTATDKMIDESRTRHFEPFVTQGQWTAMLKAAR